jgi:hypothetical protein
LRREIEIGRGKIVDELMFFSDYSGETKQKERRLIISPMNAHKMARSFMERLPDFKAVQTLVIPSIMKGKK